MKKRLYFVLLYLCTTHCFGQNWVDKKFEYKRFLNVPYGTAINFNGGTDTLKMDIYTPICSEPENSLPRPLMMCVHGGAFLAGDKSESSISNICQQFASRGYVTASINYRLGFIADDVAWNCNYPNYSCVFGADIAEWYRAYFRAIQDGKGALRYLINRNSTLLIDTGNIFITGESAGAFIALGIALMDTIAEKPGQAYDIGEVPRPSTNTFSCIYNKGKSYNSAAIKRPDLGNVSGTIEPTTINYTIKGIGNMYGGMVNDLLKYQKGFKPSIYSFHQPCDMVVPIDSGAVYQGLSWCLTNGYNCYGISNTPKVFGSRAISKWNTQYQYGFTIHNEFTSTPFPYNFLFGSGSCADQVNNPCHAFDNSTLRENNLAAFFAPLITTIPFCDATSDTQETGDVLTVHQASIYPNPANHQLYIDGEFPQGSHLEIYTIYGHRLMGKFPITEKTTTLDLGEYADGLYILNICQKKGPVITMRFIKQ